MIDKYQLMCSYCIKPYLRIFQFLLTEFIGAKIFYISHEMVSDTNRIRDLGKIKTLPRCNRSYSFKPPAPGPSYVFCST